MNTKHGEELSVVATGAGQECRLVIVWSQAGQTCPQSLTPLTPLRPNPAKRPGLPAPYSRLLNFPHARGGLLKC